MKSINTREILKDANISKEDFVGKIYEHEISSGYETFTIFTKNAKFSLVLNAIRIKDGKRFRFFKALYKKAEKFGGSIIIGEAGSSERLIATVMAPNRLSVQ